MSEPAAANSPRPVARSPVALPRTGVAASAGALTLVDLSLSAKIVIHAPATSGVHDALGVSFGRAARPSTGSLAGALVIGSRPGEWMVVGDEGSARRLLDATEWVLASTDGFASRVDVSHGRALLRLTGAAAAALLAKVCAIDLSDGVVPGGAAFRSSVARVAAEIVRDDVGDGPAGRSYLIHCEGSSGQYLAGALVDAGREFGLITVATGTGRNHGRQRS